MNFSWIGVILLLRTLSFSAQATSTGSESPLHADLGSNFLSALTNLANSPLCELSGKTISSKTIVTGLKSLIPFGQVLAAAVERVASDAELNQLIDLSKKTLALLENIGGQQVEFIRREEYRDAMAEYRQKVHFPLRTITLQFEHMLAAKFWVGQKTLDEFLSSCIKDYMPHSSVRYLQDVIASCGKPTINPRILMKIENAIEKQKYLENTENEEIDRTKIAILYQHLERSPHELTSAIERFRDSTGSYSNNKNAFLTAMISYFGANSGIACPVKQGYVIADFNREVVHRQEAMWRQSLNSLGYMARMCANVSFAGNIIEANAYYTTFNDKMEKVLAFIDTWIPQLLRNAWPRLYKFKMEKFLKTTQLKCENGKNATCSAMAKKVHGLIKHMGHTELKPEVIVSKGANVIPRSDEYYIDGDATEYMVFDRAIGNVAIFRHNISSSSFYKEQLKLTELVNATFSNFSRLMNSDFYSTYIIEDALVGLKENGVDLLTRTSFKGIVVIRSRGVIFQKHCEVAVGSFSYRNLGPSTIRRLVYYTAGAAGWRCEHWLFLLV